VLHSPDLLLLDEPTSGLDPESAREVRDLVLRLKDQRRAILLSTHNLDEVDRVATRVAVLRTRLVAADTPAALRETLFGAHVRIVVHGPAGRYADAVRRAGAARVDIEGSTLTVDISAAQPTIPALVRALVEAGADVESVTRETPSLEQVYLRLVGEGR
jgi:ABC-2 type transport system ATP-binding protein